MTTRSKQRDNPTTEHNRFPPSPVPSDMHLWPGELPYTAFGQWGEDRLDLRVFDQATYWVDRHGDPHLIAHMSRHYRKSVIAMLESDAEHFHILTIHRWAYQLEGDVLLGRHDRACVALANAANAASTDAEAWLRATPLMHALRTVS